MAPDRAYGLSLRKLPFWKVRRRRGFRQAVRQMEAVCRDRAFPGEGMVPARRQPGDSSRSAGKEHVLRAVTAAVETDTAVRAAQAAKAAAETEAAARAVSAAVTAEEETDTVVRAVQAATAAAETDTIVRAAQAVAEAAVRAVSAAATAAVETDTAVRAAFRAAVTAAAETEAAVRAVLAAIVRADVPAAETAASPLTRRSPQNPRATARRRTPTRTTVTIIRRA